MKTLLAAVGLCLVTGAGAAMAGEGNGDPFPFQGPPLSVTLNGYQAAVSKTQDPFPFGVPGTRLQADRVLPSAGSEGVVQTANSMPAGAMSGPATAMVNRQAAPAIIAQPSVRTLPRG